MSWWRVIVGYAFLFAAGWVMPDPIVRFLAGSVLLIVGAAFIVLGLKWKEYKNKIGE